MPLISKFPPLHHLFRFFLKAKLNKMGKLSPLRTHVTGYQKESTNQHWTTVLAIFHQKSASQNSTDFKSLSWDHWWIEKTTRFFPFQDSWETSSERTKKESPKTHSCLRYFFRGWVFFFRETCPKKTKQNKTKEITTPDWMVQCGPYQPIVYKSGVLLNGQQFVFMAENKWLTEAFYRCHQNQWSVFSNIFRGSNPLTTERPVGWVHELPFILTATNRSPVRQGWCPRNRRPYEGIMKVPPWSLKVASRPYFLGRRLLRGAHLQGPHVPLWCLRSFWEFEVLQMQPSAFMTNVRFGEFQLGELFVLCGKFQQRSRFCERVLVGGFPAKT